jgi:hypothetical protein
MNLKTLPEFQKHLIRHRLGEGIIIRAIANEVNVSTNTVLLPKEMFVSITRGIFVICHHNIVNLFVSKPELNGANLPNLDLNSCHFCPPTVQFSGTCLKLSMTNNTKNDKYNHENQNNQLRILRVFTTSRSEVHGNGLIPLSVYLPGKRRNPNST